MVDDLTTFAMCKAVLGAAAEDEILVSKLVTAASIKANNYTSRKLRARALTEYYDGDGTYSLFLDNYPINSITSVYQDSDRVFGEDTLVDSDEYLFYPDGRRTLAGISTGWYSGIQTIKITYNAGYTHVPEDLENAILMLIDFWYKSYDAHRFGVKSTGVDDQRIVYELGIPVQVRDLFAPYIKKVIL